MGLVPVATRCQVPGLAAPDMRTLVQPVGGNVPPSKLSFKICAAAKLFAHSIMATVITNDIFFIRFFLS